MNDHTPDAVGVDISKAALDVHRHATGEAARFANEAAGFEQLADRIGAPAGPVVYESTGPWHRAFEESLAGSLPLARVNALRARRFAQAMGEEAKADRTDARVLAAMGSAMVLRRTEPRSPTQRDLDELVTARDALLKDRTAALNREKHVRHRLLRRQLKNRLAQVARQIKALDEEIAKVAEADAELSRRMEVLTSNRRRRTRGRDGPARGHARTRARRRQGGCEPRRGRALDARVRPVAGAQLHPRRSRQAATSALHGRRRRVALQPGHGPQVHRAASPRQAAEGRPDRSHAQAGGSGQRAAQAGPAVDAEPGARVRLRVPAASGHRHWRQGAPSGSQGRRLGIPHRNQRAKQERHSQAAGAKARDLPTWILMSHWTRLGIDK